VLDRPKGVLQDLRFFFREFRKKPGLALTAIVSLALGAGRMINLVVSAGPDLGFGHSYSGAPGVVRRSNGHFAI
jgi:hypothetical protein